MDADSPLDPRFLPDAVKGAENRGLSDEGLLPSHHKRGERFPLQQQVPFLRSTFFLHICRRKRRAPGSLGWRSRRHLRWPLGSQALGDAAAREVLTLQQGFKGLLQVSLFMFSDACI